MEQKVNILYIDDEISNLTAFKASFRRDFNVFIASTILEAKSILEGQEIQVILTDQRMPEMTGVEFLQSIIQDYPDPIRILVTGYSDIQAVIDAINKGKVYNYISKPWEKDYLKVVLDKANEVYSLRRENKELTKNLLKSNQQLEFMLRQKLTVE